MRLSIRQLTLTTSVLALFGPAELFAASEPGIWLDPSDITTLYQDTAGTTPVTTPGQSVALALDKSKGLVLGPELVTNGTFDSGTTGWTLSGGTATVSSGQVTISGATTRYLSQSFTTVIGQGYRVRGTIVTSGATFNAIRKADNSTASTNIVTFIQAAGTVEGVFIATATTSWIVLQVNDAGTATFDNISVKELPGFHATQATAGSRPIYGIVPVGGTRNILRQTATLATQTRVVTAAQHTLSFRGTGTVTLTGTSTAGPLVGTGAGNIVSLTFTPTAGNLTLTVSGTVNDAQLELGSARSGYQLVSDAGGYNVTEAGVSSLSYLAFDGVDDFLVTPTITPGIDKAQVFAGVRKLSDPADAIVAELGTGAANGSFYLGAPVNAAIWRYSLQSRGTIGVNANVTAAGFVAPITTVVAGLADISGDVATIRANGVQQGQNTGDQGTGNFLAYPLYIGRRAATSLAFNGNLFSLIVRFGANLTADQITSTETWVNVNTGAY